MTPEGEHLPVRAVARVEDLLPPSRPRRIVLFGKRKAHTRVTAHLARGFRRHGHRVLRLRPGHARGLLGRSGAEAWARRRALAFRPDLAVVYKHDATPELLDALPARVPRVVYYEDLPLELEKPGERILQVGRRAEILFTTARGMVPVFQQLGVRRAVYLRGGVDDVDHRRGRRRRRHASECAFIGSAFGEDRIALLRAVHARFRLSVYGEGWDRVGLTPRRTDVFPRQYRDICASAGVMLGIDLRNDVDLYTSNRTWLTLGCGGFLLTRYAPNLEELFENHRHLVWFHSIEECLELLDRYLARDAERERIAREGHAYVHAYHTFRHATAEIVGTAFGEPWHRGMR